MSARRATVRPGRPPWMEAIRPLSRESGQKGIPRRSRWAERQAAVSGSCAPTSGIWCSSRRRAVISSCRGLTILPHVRRAPSRCEDLKFPAGLPAGTCPYYKRRRAGPQGDGAQGDQQEKFLFFEGGIWLQWVKNAVLCQHITGPRRRAGKDDPIAAEEKKHEGTGSAGGSVHGADSGARGLAVETAAGTPPAVTEAPYSDVPAEAWYAPSRRT